MEPRPERRDAPAQTSYAMVALDESAATLPSQHGKAHERVLLVFCGATATEHVLPESGVVVVGRGRTSDVVIDHPTLSRVHAKLSLGTHVTIEDCGARNGTIVAGRHLSPGEVVLVAPGAPIEVGDVLLVIRAGTRGGGDLLASSSDGGLEKGASLDRTVARIAEADVSVLIVGEHGSGKAFLARRIHERSARRAGPLVTLSCATVHDDRELAERAAQARGGVLVIHEPTLLSPVLQTALVGVLRAEASAIRVIAISSDEPAAAAARGNLSFDLLHRLDAVSIAVPPLRARLRELPAIAESILAAVAAKQGRRPPLLSADALAALGRHSWPGNVRELENALTRAVLVGSSRVLTATHLALDPKGQAAGAGTGTLSSAVSEAEHRRILEALRQCNGNQTRAAKLLGISRGTLISRLERYAVPRPRK